MKITEKNGNHVRVEAGYCHYRRNYIALITGTDPKWGLSREFVSKKFDMSSSGKNGSLYAIAREGDILEYRDGNTYKNENNKYYYRVEDGALVEITEIEVLEKFDQ